MKKNKPKTQTHQQKQNKTNKNIKYYIITLQTRIDPDLVSPGAWPIIRSEWPGIWVKTTQKWVHLTPGIRVYASLKTYLFFRNDFLY